VKPREELYVDGFAGLAPDIVFGIRKGYAVTPGLRDCMFDYNPQVCGGHEPEGVFIAAGPSIRRSHRLESADMVDIAPTMLYLLGLPVDAQMEGRVLEDIFVADYLAEHPPEFCRYSDVLDFGKPEGSYSESDEEIVRKRLKGLGYM